MATISTQEKMRRLRAAWGYSALSQEELATRSGVKQGTLRAYLERSKPSAPRDDETLYVIAEACGLPRRFIDVGFEPLRDPISDAERDLYALREEHRALVARVAAIEAGPSLTRGIKKARSRGTVRDRPASNQAPAELPKRGEGETGA